MKLVKAI